MVSPTLRRRFEHNKTIRSIIDATPCATCVGVSHLASVCRSSGNPQPKAKGGQKGKGGGKRANVVKTCWNCGESGPFGGSWQPRHFDVGSVSEMTHEPRGADKKICSMGAPDVREGESVDIDIDSGAEVSCLPVNIGAETYPLHETRLSMCGGHHVAAGGGRLHELGARILGLEAANVRGDLLKLLVRFRVMNIGKALLSTQDLRRCGWETVFPAGFGNAYLVRKASDTRITLVKKRCAWYLRAKLKPHNELPCTESEEFLEVMSMDQRAGVWPVEEGGGSSSSGPAVPEDVEQSEPVRKIVALTAPTATDREEHTASRHAMFGTWRRECRIGRGRMHQHRAGGKRISIPAIAIDHGYLNERDDRPDFGQ